MKTNRTIAGWLMLAAIITVNIQPSTASAQGTAFTYQGRLNNNSAPANGSYDFRFRLASDPNGNTYVGSPVLTNGVAVNNGLFLATLDFGGAFNGSTYWLEVDVKTNGAAGYTELAPLQPFTPTPYAIMANSASNLLGNLSAGQLTGTLANGALPTSPNFSGTVTAGTFSGSGANLTSLNANNLASGTVPLGQLSGITGGQLAAATWQLATNLNGGNAALASNVVSGISITNAFITNSIFAGNGASVTNLNANNLTSGTVPLGQLNGITGNQLDAAAWQQATNLNGGKAALASNVVSGIAITNAFITNSVFAGNGGGLTNLNASQLAGGTVPTSVLPGFQGINYQTVGGGSNNVASGQYATVGGGSGNVASSSSATVAGGQNNTANNTYATVGGGYNNSAGYVATIPGGANNLASGYYSFAAGQRAKATNQGAFVWADSQGADFSSTNNDQFLIRAQGGVGIGTNVTAGNALTVAGNVAATSFSGNGSGLMNVTAATLAIPQGMALIPAGTFTMGDSLDGETDAMPTTNITVSAFYMDINLVSYAQWQSVFFWATNHGYGFVNAGAGKAANHPVQTVDWYDSVKWSNARSQQAGLTPVYYTDAGLTQVYTNGEVTPYMKLAANGYRLPTEAEWEKAARGGLNGQRFPWGNVITENLANYYGATASYSYDLGPDGSNTAFTNGVTPYTSPVGYFAPNGYGLYDMADDVTEWCWDWYGTPYGQPTNTNPTGPVTGSNRVLRGGYWNYLAYYSRCAYRNYYYPYYAYVLIGFRCVRGL